VSIKFSSLRQLLCRFLDIFIQRDTLHILCDEVHVTECVDALIKAQFVRMVQLGQHLDLTDQVVLYLFIDQLVFLVDLDGHELPRIPMLRPPDLSVTTDPEQAPVLLDLVLVQVLAIRPGRAKLRALELQVALGVSLEKLPSFPSPCSVPAFAATSDLMRAGRAGAFLRSHWQFA
jgi:hypothetical protein